MGPSAEVAAVSTVASVEMFPVVVVDMEASFFALLSVFDCGVVLVLLDVLSFGSVHELMSCLQQLLPRASHEHSPVGRDGHSQGCVHASRLASRDYCHLHGGTCDPDADE